MPLRNYSLTHSVTQMTSRATRTTTTPPSTHVSDRAPDAASCRLCSWFRCTSGLGLGTKVKRLRLAISQGQKVRIGDIQGQKVEFKVYVKIWIAIGDIPRSKGRYRDLGKDWGHPRSKVPTSLTTHLTLPPAASVAGSPRRPVRAETRSRPCLLAGDVSLMMTSSRSERSRMSSTFTLTLDIANLNLLTLDVPSHNPYLYSDLITLDIANTTNPLTFVRNPNPDLDLNLDKDLLILNVA